MATGIQIQQRVPEKHLRKQLSVAVRSIQWSYAIFWSTSTKQQRVLEWGNGYYNGDIKTTKTMQPTEFNVDKVGLQRSEQLRELYDSLSVGENNQQARRPSASLSPENLSDAEWYYLVCMSFTFNFGNGLPGRAYSSDQHIWLCNAHHADCKVFSRSLLAKSASIKTVLCFPLLGGVMEFGATEMVMEDLNLLQHLKTVFLEFPMPICSEKSLSIPGDLDNDEDPVCKEIGHDVLDSIDIEEPNPVVDCGIQTEGAAQIFPFSAVIYPKVETEFGQNGAIGFDNNLFEDSLDDSSDGGEPNQLTEDSFMLEGINNEPSQVQSWQFLDDDLSNCIHGSMYSSECISQTVLNCDKQEMVNNLRFQDLQECNHTKLSLLDIGTDDLHYTRTLSVILNKTSRLGATPSSRNGNHKSSFGSWKNGSSVLGVKLPTGTSQKMLKKILLDVARMHTSFSFKPKGENGSTECTRPEGEGIGVSGFLVERREQVKQHFRVLGSLIPSTKLDKASILGNTIEYLKDLERRVEELESCREVTEIEAKGRRKHPDIVERTSDNYGSNGIVDGKKPPINKRKACDIVEVDHELNWVLSKGGSAAEITVSIDERDVTIKMQCASREGLLLDIVDAISELHLDAHSVHSSTLDGLLTLTLKTKFQGNGLISAGKIEVAILRVIDTR